MSVEVLPPILAALRAREPGLVIELVVSNRLQDLLHREADIAVRMTPPRHDALIARRIGSAELGMHAHRDYLARRTAEGLSKRRVRRCLKRYIARELYRHLAATGIDNP